MFFPFDIDFLGINVLNLALHLIIYKYYLKYMYVTMWGL